MTLREKVIPIIDIQNQWNIKRSQTVISKEYIIVTSFEGKETGWLVDEVIEIVMLKEENLQAIEWGKQIKKNTFIEKVWVNQAGQLVGVLSQKAFQSEQRGNEDEVR